jgi:hypothetical protein
VGVVTSVDAQAALSAARRLRDRLRDWLTQKYPGPVEE